MSYRKNTASTSVLERDREERAEVIEKRHERNAALEDRLSMLEAQVADRARERTPDRAFVGRKATLKPESFQFEESVDQPTRKH